MSSSSQTALYLQDGSQDSSHTLPSWSYATKKTVAKGFLNASLLFSNATALKKCFQISKRDRDNWWSATVGLIITSLVLQAIAAVLIGILAMARPKTQFHTRKVTVRNDIVTFLVILISFVNYAITGIGVDTGPTV